ncbi:MAG: hypothetical protein R3B95_06525 [Nitrospirales bacterium]|nr:DUF1330 domain-containing protein [Nitrospirales bacterium]
MEEHPGTRYGKTGSKGRWRVQGDYCKNSDPAWNIMTTLTAGERLKDWCQSGGLIEFPGLERANLWYGSSTYQAIKHVCSNKTESVVSRLRRGG